jgi:glutamate-1-semialdehyde 2,1-aminomutase
MADNGQMIDRTRLDELIDRERQLYADRHPSSREAAARGAHLLCGVPMTWMAKWAGGFPLQLARAAGASVTDVDGITYSDFCLGDTGAMAGHSPAPTLAALRNRALEAGGITAMLPSEDASVAADELARRFDLPVWSFTLTATDANRWAIRIARHITKRPKILVFNWCYHGSVDETFAVLENGVVRAREGNVGPPVDPAVTTRVVEFNDLAGVERELAAGDVAVVVAEPALTNIGIVLPEPGFHQRLRQLTRDAGTLLLLDETHTFSAGPSGATGAWGLEPDLLTLGKAIAGGIPAGAYGLSAEVTERVASDPDADLIDVGGIGGTLAGNALSTAAVRATLTEVLTEDAFDHMTRLMERYVAGVDECLAATGLPWSITRLGARAEFRYCSPAPHNGAESADAEDEAIDEYLHLFLTNRDVLLTPFHNMALTCPGTTDEQVGSLLEGFRAAAAELVG